GSPRANPGLRGRWRHQGTIAFRFNNRREGVVPAQKFDVDRFGLATLRPTPVGVPDVDRVGQHQTQLIDHRLGSTRMAAPGSTHPAMVWRRICSARNRPRRASSTSPKLATSKSMANRPTPLTPFVRMLVLLWLEHRRSGRLLGSYGVEHGLSI